jgi:Protein of unknown function (DUF3300)
MSAKLFLAATSLLTVALFVSTVGHARPDQAPPSAADGLAAAGEASVPARMAEPSATASEAETATTTGSEGLAPKPEAETPPLFKTEQLDQLLAPVALYPDALLAQILMAATYPLEIVKAARWLQDSNHASLRADQLANAVETEAWDPSVKSLVPFPRILRMMDEQLDWTEQLGNAVVAQQADVMDTIQRLRYEAAEAGTLWSNAQQRVTTEGQGIVIEPANPEYIYPPVYSPAGVFGPWPYPDYPPFDIFPAGPDFGLEAPLGIGFGVGFAVVRPLSRWCAFDWRQRRIELNVDKFNALNRHMPGIETNTWHRDPSRLRLRLGDFASRAPFQVFRGSSLSTRSVPRISSSSTAAFAPMPMRSSMATAFAPIGQARTAVLRPTPRSFAPVGRGFQPGIVSRPSLTSRQMALAIMPWHLAPPMISRTIARPTALAPGGGARFGGAFHR